MGPTNRHAPGKCPKCKKNLDAATGISDSEQPPDEDSITICCYCCVILQYNKDMSLRLANPIILKELDPEEQIKVQRVIRFQIQSS